jgi:hypothetical protein
MCQLCHRRSVVYRTGLLLIQFTCPCLQLPRLGPLTIKTRNIRGKEWIRAIVVINHMGIGAGDHKAGR